ncbi:hypothetical protein AAII07_53670 [Microvirga sp. 0TCS3.31]
MPVPLSQELRKRIVRAVTGGSSIRQTALRFEIRPSAAVKLMRCFRQSGSSAPARVGRCGVMILLIPLVPILTTNGHFFVDIPNHLYRVSIINEILYQGVPSSYFHISYRLYPNMAMDVVTGLLTTIMSPAAALMVFLCGTVLAYLTSILSWRASLGQRTDAAVCLLIVLILYSEMVYWGFFNYVLGLSIMHVCMALLNHQTIRPSRFFPVTQAGLIALLCLTSIFPVILYVAFCAGSAFEALRSSAPGARRAALGRLFRQHGLSAMMVVTLVSAMDPGQMGSTNWSIQLKLLGIFSIAKTTYVLPEYAISALTLVCLATLVWQRGLVADRDARAGTLACCLLYLALPEELHGVHLTDRRVAPAIAGLVLVLIRGPQPAATRFSTTALTMGLSLLIAIKAGILAHVWTPLASLQASYRTISALIPSGAFIVFVPPLEGQRWGAGTHVRAYLRRLSHFERIPPEEAHQYIHYYHLHFAELIGKDVYSPHVFTNLALKANLSANPLPFLAHVADLPELRTKLHGAVIAPNIYLISHVDLQPILLHRLRARKLMNSGPITLYRTEPVE